MRDIALTAVFSVLVIWSLGRHHVGPLLWAWVSMMSPHRLTYGFAYSLPFAQISALCVLVVFPFSKSRRPFPVTTPSVLLIVFYLWECITSLASFNTPADVYDMWFKVTKIQIMLFVTMMMLAGRKQIEALIWVIVVSIGFYGVKGGLFTISRGGTAMVMGPPGSFIEVTNHLALAMLMTVPLMLYLVGTVSRRWGRLALYAAMVLTSLSVLGTTSRGAFVAICTMAALWSVRSKHKVISFVFLGIAALGVTSIMSEKWESKMSTIKTHEDHSAQSRLYTWKMIWNMASYHPVTGGGFQVTENPATWAKYAVTEYARAYSPHSIYFQALAEHGFVGLFLYLMIGFTTWRLCNSMIRRSRVPGREWAGNLARMIQLALLGFATGGAFVNLVNFDLPYYLVALAVLADVALKEEEKTVAVPAGAVAPA